MNILAVDTAGEGLSLALSGGAEAPPCRASWGLKDARPGGAEAPTIARSRARASDRALFPALERLLARRGWTLNEIEGIVASAGPGRFTAVRVGMTFSAILAKCLGIPVVPVSRLEALALRPHAAPEPRSDAAFPRDSARSAAPRGERRFAAAIPAFKGEWYFQFFRAGGGTVVPEGEPLWLPAGGLDAAAEGVPILRADLSPPLSARDLLVPGAPKLRMRRTPPMIPLYLKPANFQRFP